MAIRTSLLLFFHLLFLIASAQENPRHFTINKLFASHEFYPDRYGDVTWSANGEAYYRLEYTESGVDRWMSGWDDGLTNSLHRTSRLDRLGKFRRLNAEY